MTEPAHAKRQEPQAPRRSILIVRLSAIGDIVFASPLVTAFRHTSPQAHIAWLVQPECAPLLAHHPHLDEVIPWPYRHWQNLWRTRQLKTLAHQVATFREDLRGRRFDLAVDLQGLLKSGLLTRFSDAPERIGLGSREGSQWLMTRTVPRGGESDRIGSEYRYLAEVLGLSVEDFGMRVHYGPEDAAYADELISRHGLSSGYAVLCPFTTRPQKHWIEVRWAEVAIRLRADLGLSTVMLGGPNDREAAGRVGDLATAGLVDLAGQTTLLQAAALIDRSALLIGVDTGLSHMGIAFGRPSLLLFGSTCPYTDTGRPNARVLYQRLSCSPCKRKPTCNGEFTCMRLLTTHAVLEAATGLLDVRP